MVPKHHNHFKNLQHVTFIIFLIISPIFYLFSSNNSKINAYSSIFSIFSTPKILKIFSNKNKKKFKENRPSTCPYALARGSHVPIVFLNFLVASDCPNLYFFAPLDSFPPIDRVGAFLGPKQ